MSRDFQSIHGVWLQNLNWGYQVGHGNMVLAAIHDTVGGPRRTDVCSYEALKKYELICPIYERLYRHKPPTQRQLALLAHIIRGDVTDERHNYGKPDGRVAKSLMERGIIVRVAWYDSYRNFAVLDSDGKTAWRWDK